MRTYVCEMSLIKIVYSIILGDWMYIKSTKSGFLTSIKYAF